MTADVIINSLWVVLQLLVAGCLGAVIGLEREMSAQPAGLRTHMLVALGAALFTLVGARVFGADPTRVAAQIVTGIGFLGGGAIVRDGFTTRGLTTAAALWVTAAIGLAIGLREWFAAAVATAVALIVLYTIRRLERQFVPRLRSLDATLTLAPGASMQHVAEAVTRTLPGSRLLRVSYSGEGQSLVMKATSPRDEPLAKVGDLLRGTPGVVGVDLSW